MTNGLVQLGRLNQPGPQGLMEKTENLNNILAAV